MDLRELYQETILDHNRNPRNHYCMEEATAQARGFNPLCGDQLTIYIRFEGNYIKEVSFLGSGCAISQASASLMTEALMGKTREEAEKLFRQFHGFMTDKPVQGLEKPSYQLDKLMILEGVKLYPARVKCATLAWHTLEAALQEAAETVTTE
ncbi:MAG: SUF system NifU family Fe-S cluster assembly protein [Legionella sp.]|nr:SUF system NifU family Fe-S cluster assembly protein [Legionella sp.]